MWTERRRAGRSQMEFGNEFAWVPTETRRKDLAMEKSAFGKHHIITVMAARHTRLNLLLAVFLAAALAPGIIFAQVAFKIPIRVADAAGHNATLWFGVHPQATNCIDTTVFGACDSANEYGTAPIGPGGVFDTRFIPNPEFPATACLDQGEYINIQKFSSTTQIDSYYIYVQPGTTDAFPTGFPITLSWPSNVSTLCDSALLIDNASGGFSVNAHLNKQTSVSFTKPSIKQLNLYLYGPKHSAAIPAVPTLTFPANAAGGVDTSLTFTWQPVAGAVGYTIQVSADPQFGSFILSDTAAGTSKKLSGLSQRTKYYWQVRASSSYVTSCYQSPAFQFTTTLSPPGIPLLIIPAAGDTTIATTPTFRWFKAAYADSYHVQVARDVNFTSIISDVMTADTSIQVGSFPNCTSLNWRAFGKNPSGQSASSAVVNFKIVSVVPGTPALVTPHAGDTLQNVIGAALESCRPLFEDISSAGGNR